MPDQAKLNTAEPQPVILTHELQEPKQCCQYAADCTQYASLLLLLHIPGPVVTGGR
jgi:hypothetical protein